MVEAQGLKPWTPCLQSRCSNQLSYAPIREVYKSTLFGANFSHSTVFDVIYQDRGRVSVTLGRPAFKYNICIFFMLLEIWLIKLHIPKLFNLKVFTWVAMSLPFESS